MVKDKVSSYIHYISKTKAKAIENLVEEVFVDEQEIPTDGICWTLACKGVLMNPYCYRRYLEEVYKKNPVQANIENVFAAFGNFGTNPSSPVADKNIGIELEEKDN